MSRPTLTLALLLLAAPAVAQGDDAPHYRTIESPPLLLAQSEGIDHGPWDTIVSTYVRDGRFDYAGLAANPVHVEALAAYRAALATADPSSWTREQQLAFWINAYNAHVVAGVLDNLARDPAFAGVLTVEGFFDAVRYETAGQSITLNELENERIRATFHEPRIHFAVNCASVGCPPLRAEAYTAEALEAQLAEQTAAFVGASTSYDANTNTVSVSQLFEWFAGDFEAAGGVRAFIAGQVDGDLAATVRDEANTLQYTTYDWALNATP
jgi:hypothetical protein